MSDFRLGEAYPRQYIATKLGGGIQRFLPRSNGQVVACCYKPADNILAPEMLLVGGTGRYADAKVFARQANFIPFFRKVGIGGWEYVGRFRVRRYSEDPATIAEAKIRGNDSDVRIVLYIEPEREVSARFQTVAKPLGGDSITFEPTVAEFAAPAVDDAEVGGHSMPAGGPPSLNRQMDSEKRALVEAAAISCVYEHFNEYDIDDRQTECIGWDLEAVKNSEKLLLEVKGTSGNQIRAELTPNEYKNMQRYPEDYRVCVVVNALAHGRTLHVLRFLPKLGVLMSESGLIVRLSETTGAQLFE